MAIFDVTSNKQLTTDPIIAFPTLDALRQEVEINPDVIIVSCKAYDNEFAAEDLERILGEDSSIKIVLLQNGVGNEEVFYEKFPDSPVYRLISSDGALLLSPGRVLHAGHGTGFIGITTNKASDNFAPEFSSLLSDVGLDTRDSSNIGQETWKKCLINSTINPIASINRVVNGELVNRRNLEEMATNVVWETVDVFRQRRLYTPNSNPVDMVMDVAKKTAKNKCSMLRDLECRRPTEIDFLNGRIIREAAIAGIDVPFNYSLYNQVKHLEFVVATPF